MKNDTKLVPKRRFKEFEDADDWETRKLGDVARFSKGKGYSKNDLLETGTPIILYGSLYTNYQTVIRKVNTFTKDKINSIYSLGNEVIVPSSGETAEDIARASVVGQEGIILGGDLNIIHLNNDINSVFLALSISNGDRKKELIKKAQGKSVVHLYNTDLLEVKFSYPSKQEQIQIGTFFKKIDKLITLNQLKLEKIKDLKLAYLSDMFPKAGERYPKVRFVGCTSTWEQRRLDLVADVRDGTHDSPQYYSSGHPFITSKNVKNGFINYDGIQYISDKDFEQINKRSKVNKNDILMGMIGTIGNLALVRETSDFAIKNVALIKDTKDIYYLYLYYCLQSPNILNQLLEGLDGGTQKFIALNKIRNLLIAVPDIEEQYKIGNYMQHLDNLITLHQQKLDKLKNIKKAYLNEMFV